METSSLDPVSPRRMRVTLAELMGLVAFVALGCRWPTLFVMAVPLVPCLVSLRFTGGWNRFAWICYGLVLGAVYLPALQGFLLDCSHCREFWVKYFPIVPAVVPGWLVLRCFGLGRLPDGFEFLVAALTLLGFLSLFLYLARRGGIWLYGVLAAALIGSALSTWVLASVIRS